MSMLPYAIGIDLVRIARFDAWTSYTNEQLRRIFSLKEIEKAASKGAKKAEFLAGRFAAREAFYKALCQLLCAQNESIKPFTFAALAPCIQITNDERWGLPTIHIEFDAFFKKTGISLPSFNASLSIAHEGEYAFATVLLTIITR